MTVLECIKREADGVRCPKCKGYAERVDCTPEELKEYNCGRSSFECCARAFVCGLCWERLVGTAQAPEME